MEDLTQIEGARKYVVQRLNTIAKYVKSFKKSDDVIQLKVRLTTLEKLEREFHDIQVKIISKLLTAENSEQRQRDLENHEMESSSFDKEFYNTMSKIQSKIEERNKTSQQLAKTQIELPKYDLPTFNGDLAKFMAFHDSFESLIHSNDQISDVQKFHFLKSALKDEAVRVIEPFVVSGANYEDAWAAVVKRYKNERLIITKHVFNITNASEITKSSHAAIRQLSDDLTVNLAALTALNINTDTWNYFLVPVIAEKLDNASKREWQATLTNKMPLLSEFTEFLEKRCRVLESVQSVNANTESHQGKAVAKAYFKTKFNQKTYSHVTTNNKANNCQFCDKHGHAIYQCDRFLGLTVQNRVQQCQKLKLCKNCLKLHSQECTSRFKCKLCHGAHNTLLHLAENQLTETLTHCARSDSEAIILSTAVILVQDAKKRMHECRILLDQGSQSNFITESMIKKIGLSTQESPMIVGGIGEFSRHVSKAAQVTIASRTSSFEANVKCLIVSRITENLPNFVINRADIKIPPNIELADPRFTIPGPIDMLIGAEHFWEIISNDRKRLELNGPVLQPSQFGWLIGGPIHKTTNKPKTSFCHLATNLEKQVEKFWLIEEIAPHKPLSVEEKLCEEHFVATFQRDIEGRFIAELPSKTDRINLGSSKEMATRRYLSLETKLNKNPELKSSYIKFITDYKDLEHMELVPNAELNNKSCYLPHHAVIKQQSLTTKCRVVFDASAKTSNGKSLNDNLLAGPVIQQDLFLILIRFRTFKYVLNADITKMYRQILLNENQRDLHRILWRDDIKHPIQIFRLKTLTYGTKPASFIATRCLFQLAEENEELHSEACRVIKRDFYMDDLLTGGETIDDVIRLREEIIKILNEGKFVLRKWSSNDQRILAGINDASPNAIIQFDDNAEIKVLGVVWNCVSDSFKYNANDTPDLKQRVTKRSILSTLAKMFDPLGHLSPVIIQGKILIQRLWADKLGWDDDVPINIKETWTQMVREIKYLNEINIPRYVFPNEKLISVQLHGFCDSSEQAYGAAIYVRAVDTYGNVSVKLMCAKSKVAPLKQMTIPRLELCGALLLAKLVQKVVDEAQIKFDDRILWSDSTIVLAWLKSTTSAWKIFVANRVEEIRHLTANCEWRHIRSEDNPADVISRGLSPVQIKKHTLWWSGPEWLRDSSDEWPRTNNQNDANVEIPERKTVSLAVPVTKCDILAKYSSFEKLCRIVAYCRRFVNNARGKNRTYGHLSASELRESKRNIIKIVQSSEFFDDLSRVGKSRNSYKGKLACLDPFVDTDGILRVGGRLRNSGAAYDKRHPIILPKKHHISELLIRREHERQLHAGTQGTLAALRENYWIIDGRSAVRNILFKCIRCFKTKPRALSQKMGDLPACRLEPLRPFFKTGVDFAGPLLIRESKGRGKRRVKAYVAVFVCMATKALHLELVTDLSAETFLNVLNRLVARRGHVGHIYCDNATNFVGASNILAAKRVCPDENTRFHFIPPRSPNFGGLWERAVRSVKNHLFRVVGDASITYEEMYTLLVRVEAILNSRPLTPLSSDPNDLSVLTPGHFLVGEPLTAVPEDDIKEVKQTRLSRWQRMEQLRQHLWQRFYKEYLSQLQSRPKWHTESALTLTEGTLVIVRENNIPPLQWPVARVKKLHVGKDGVARVAVIKTNRGEFTRSVRNLCVLPIDK